MTASKPASRARGLSVIRVLILAALAFSFVSSAAAQTWKAPRADEQNLRKLGVVAIRIERGGGNTVVDAIACLNRQPSMILAGTGGEPFTGSTRISVGQNGETITFSDDPTIQRLINVPGVRAPLSRETLAALRDAREFKYQFKGSPIPLTGLPALWPAVAAACGFEGAASAQRSENDPPAASAPQRAAPVGRWALLNGEACDTLGQFVEIAPGRIVVDYAGDLSTFGGVVSAGCQGEVCTFRQGAAAGGRTWMTRWLNSDSIAFRGPHGPAGGQRSVLRRAERCR